MNFLRKENFKNKMATIIPSQLVSFRSKPKDYTYTYLNFKGDGIEDKVVNEKFENGFLVFTKNCLIRDGSYFSGSPHNKLMSEPQVIFDKYNIINKNIYYLRNNLVRRIIYEHGENYDSRKYSILNTLVRKNVISPEIIDKLIKYERETRNNTK